MDFSVNPDAHIPLLITKTIRKRTSDRRQTCTDNIFQNGWSSKDVIFDALEEWFRIIGFFFELFGVVKISDVFLECLREKNQSDASGTITRMKSFVPGSLSSFRGNDHLKARRSRLNKYTHQLSCRLG
jgi:hypothetical protein